MCKFKKVISYLLIFSILFADAASCARHKAKSISNTEDLLSSLTFQKKTSRKRSASINDFRNLPKINGGLINIERPLSNTIISLGNGIIASDETTTPLLVKEPKDYSNSNGSTITSSSTHSSPRTNDTSDSSKDSPAPSPTKSSVPLSLENNPPVFDGDKNYLQGLSSIEKNEPLLDLLLKDAPESLIDDPLTNRSLPLLTFLEKETNLNTGHKTRTEELQQETEDKKTIPPLSDLVINPLEKFEEKINSPRGPILEEKQPKEEKSIPELIQNIVSSEKILTLSENDSIEVLSVSPSDASSQGKVSTSTSRRASTDSSGDLEDGVTIEPIAIQKEVVDSIVLQLVEQKQDLQNEDIPSSLPANSISHSSFSNNSTGSSSDSEGSDPFELLNDNKKRKDCDAEADGKYTILIQDYSVPLATASESEDLRFKGENRKRAPQLNSYKTIEFTVFDPEKVEGDQHEFGENKSQVSNKSQFLNIQDLSSSGTNSQKEKKRDNKEPQSADEWVYLFDNPGSSSARSYELYSFYGDQKEPRSLSINGGDEAIDIEDAAEENPLPKFIPDWCKEPYIPSEKEDISGGSLIPLDQENALQGELKTLTRFSPSKFQSQFSHMLSNLSEEDRAQLVYLKKQVLDEAYTCTQWAAIVAGVGISLLTTVGMWPIYSEGLGYLEEAYKWGWITDLDSGNAGYYVVLPLITLTILPDALGRNPHLFKKAVTAVTEKGIQIIGRTLRTAVASFLPSMIPPFFLVKLELHNMKVTNSRGLDNQFAIAMLLLGSALLADAWIANFDMAWEMEDDLKKWARTSDYLLARYISPRSMDAHIPSEEHLIRRNFAEKFDALIHTVPKMTDEKRDKIYEMFLTAKENSKKDLTDLKDQDLEEAEVLLVTRYLLACREEGEPMKKQVVACGEEDEDVKRKASSWMGDGFIIGTVAASLFMGVLVLQVMGDVLLQLGFSRQMSNDGGWIFAFFALYPLALFEYMGMKNFFKKIIPHESRIEKAAALVVGATFTVPMGVLSLQACDKWWDNDLWMITAIPLLLGVFMTLSTLFCESYNRVGTSIMKFHNQVTRKKLGYAPTASYKTNYILERIKGLQGKLEDFNDSMLRSLQKGLENQNYAKNSEL